MKGQKTNEKDQIRQIQRDLRGEGRGLDKELRDLERQEVTLLSEIKARAKQNDTLTAKTLAKSLIRLRDQKTRLINTKASMQGISANMMTQASNQKLVQALGGANKAMAAMNQQNDPQKIMETIKQFEKQNEMMGYSDDMIDSALQNMDSEDIDSEVDSEINKVLDGLNLEFKQKAPSAPQKNNQKNQIDLPSVANSELDDDLLKRLAALKQ